jgi:alpha-mannosidase
VATIEARYEFPVPADYDDGRRRSDQRVPLPVRVEYRLEAGSPALKVTLTVDNRAKDHWLRACMPTGLAAEVSWADSHFDVLARPIAVPDSTGWVERAYGTHPLRTFAGLTDGRDGLAVMPKGLYEYEAIDDQPRTLALTLIRACRIKLAVSEEKQTELPDEGIQCPGLRRFEYAIVPHAGDWRAARLLTEAAKAYVPVRAAMTGRGKGDLPAEMSLMTLDNQVLHVTCVKQAEDGDGLIVRLFNPLEEPQPAALTFCRPIERAARCRMDEGGAEPLPAAGRRIELTLAAKKIVTLRVVL